MALIIFVLAVLSLISINIGQRVYEQADHDYVQTWQNLPADVRLGFNSNSESVIAHATRGLSSTMSFGESLQIFGWILIMILFGYSLVRAYSYRSISRERFESEWLLKSADD